VAAPVFARVAEQALLRLAVPPDEPDRVLHATPYRPSNAIPAAYDPGAPGAVAAPLPAADPGVMPDVRGLSAREAALAAARLGLLVELHGSGRVVAQSPEAGAEIETGARCVLTLDRSS
jgi:cell division protein FtsI (penicillin-binding protein 3)